MNDTQRERLTIWTEHATDTHGPVLLVLPAFRDAERYEKALAGAKKKAAKNKSDSSGRIKRRRTRR